MKTGRPTRGSDHLTTDENPHPGWFVEHDDTGIVTTTTTENVSQSTPTGALDGDGAHRSREARRLVRVETHLDGAHPTDGAHDAVTWESTARRRVLVSTMGAHPDAPFDTAHISSLRRHRQKPMSYFPAIVGLRRC